MESKPLVTIIIPVFKVEKFIARCIQSVFAQSYKNIECILVNDCTPDNSAKTAQEIIDKSKGFDIKIIHHEKNIGLSDARNTGMQAAKGKYIYFLDSDDEITVKCIEILVKKAEETGAEITLGEVSCINEEENWVKDIFPIRYRDGDLIDGNAAVLKAFIDDLYPGMSCNKLVNRQFLLDNDLFFTTGLLSQDVLWGFQCSFKIKRVALVREVTYLYYFHGASIIHNRGEKHFNDWITIVSEFEKSYHKQTDPEIKKLIKQYIVRFKILTLQLNWKGQKNETLWRKSYDTYKKILPFGLYDFCDNTYSKQEKREMLLQSLPSSIGFKIFKWRFER